MSRDRATSRRSTAARRSPNGHFPEIDPLSPSPPAGDRRGLAALLTVRVSGPGEGGDSVRCALALGMAASADSGRAAPATAAPRYWGRERGRARRRVRRGAAGASGAGSSPLGAARGERLSPPALPKRRRRFPQRRRRSARLQWVFQARGGRLSARHNRQAEQPGPAPRPPGRPSPPGPELRTRAASLWGEGTDPLHPRLALVL